MRGARRVWRFPTSRSGPSGTISPTDHKFPEFSWIEVIEGARDATSILARYLHGYIVTKGLTPEQFAMLQSIRNQN